MKARIAIVDIGCGNIGAVANMLRRVADQVMIASRPEDVVAADKIVLPGVGAFDSVASGFAAAPVREAVMSAIASGKPFIGICVGMQLLADSSEEGMEKGLGLVPGACLRIPEKQPTPPGFPMPTLPVPHMGWNELRPARPHPLLAGLDAGARFYFVHSYHVRPLSADHVIAETDYGIPLAAIIGRDNVIGVQFHPEKSHTFGMKLFDNFCNRFSGAP